MHNSTCLNALNTIPDKTHPSPPPTPRIHQPRRPANWKSMPTMAKSTMAATANLTVSGSLADMGLFRTRAQSIAVPNDSIDRLESRFKKFVNAIPEDSTKEIDVAKISSGASKSN
eukprot:snap_masked-scaffold_1-processed-gene-22.46-mRNA-1 protein AED:1.00 eAED:1.00 QI:0/-1/0/0/-1/1/1/0/114